MAYEELRNEVEALVQKVITSKKTFLDSKKELKNKQKALDLLDGKVKPRKKVSSPAKQKA
jgi:hypothetical protein